MSAESLPILYSFRRCPYAIRARLALQYSGVTVALREVVLSDKPDFLMQASPKGTVPVLVLNETEQGQAPLDESLDIMFWALAQRDPDGWLDVDIEIANALIDANDEEFKPWLDRYKYPNRYDDFESAEPRLHCEHFLRQLENRLNKQGFLCGRRPSIVDYAIFPFVRQFAFADINQFRASSYGAVRLWLDTFLKSGLFASVMQKYAKWSPGDPVTEFGRKA